MGARALPDLTVVPRLREIPLCSISSDTYATLVSTALFPFPSTPSLLFLAGRCTLGCRTGSSQVSGQVASCLCHLTHLCLYLQKRSSSAVGSSRLCLPQGNASAGAKDVRGAAGASPECTHIPPCCHSLPGREDSRCLFLPCSSHNPGD